MSGVVGLCLSFYFGYRAANGLPIDASGTWNTLLYVSIAAFILSAGRVMYATLSETAVLSAEVKTLKSPQQPPMRHPDFRRAQLTEWIKLRGKEKRRIWLRQIVPDTEHYDHFVPILRQMAGPDSNIQILQDEDGEDGSPEIEFIARKQFFV